LRKIASLGKNPCEKKPSASQSLFGVPFNLRPAPVFAFLQVQGDYFLIGFMLFCFRYAGIAED